MDKINNKYLVVFISYFCVWALTRFSALNANALQMDDFLIAHMNVRGVDDISNAFITGNFSCKFPPQDGRWGAATLFCILAGFSPNWVLMLWPKLLAGLSLSLFCTLLCRRFVLDGVGLLGAVLLPLLIMTHPTVNDITLWNTPFVAAVWMTACILAFEIVQTKPADVRYVAVSFVLLLVVVLSYEIFFTVFVVLVVYFVLGGVLLERGPRRDQLIAYLVLLIALPLIYISMALLSKALGGEGRGFAEFNGVGAFLSYKFHGITNLLANVFVPVMSYYLPSSLSFRIYKWLFVLLLVAVYLCAYLARHDWKFATASAAVVMTIMAVPLAPIMLMQQNPEAWRVSIPTVFAFVLSLSLVLRLANSGGRVGIKNQNRINAVSSIVLLGLIVIQIIPTNAEAKLRALENEADQRLVAQIHQAKKSPSEKSDPKISLIVDNESRGIGSIYENHPATGMTTAFTPRGVNSAFSHFFSWRSFLFLLGMETVEIQDDRVWTQKICKRDSLGCELQLEKKARNQCKEEYFYLDKVTGMRLTSLDDENLIVVCH